MAETPASPWQAFQYWDGVVSLLPAPGVESMASAVNRAGEIAGSFATASTVLSSYGQEAVVLVSHSVVWRDGAAVPLPESPDHNDGAVGINDVGHVLINSYGSPCAAGAWMHAWLYDGGSLERIGPTDANVSAFSINNLSHVVGNAMVPGEGTRPFIYADGQYSLLPVPAGVARAGAFAINDSDLVVGFVTYGDWDDPTAALWDNGTMYDLNTLIPVDSGWVLQEAWGINSTGQIVGKGSFEGRQVAFVLTPDGMTLEVPEPNGVALEGLAGGLFCVVEGGAGSISRSNEANPIRCDPSEFHSR